MLGKVLEAVWWSDSVNQGRVRNLYHSLSVRCNLVVEAGGKSPNTERALDKTQPWGSAATAQRQKPGGARALRCSLLFCDRENYFDVLWNQIVLRVPPTPSADGHFSRLRYA